MALRDKVCTIHLIKFILPIAVVCYIYGAMAMALRDKVLYHLSDTVHPSNGCAVLYLWCDGHGSQRQGLYHPSHTVHPWLSEIRFVPSISCSLSIYLGDKVCTIHLIQFILPITVLCYIYGVMAMALRDKVLYHLSHTVHTWRSEIRFVPSISYSSYMALRDKVCTIHLVHFIHSSWRQGLYHPSHTVHTWCSETRFVPSVSYSSSTALGDKVFTIHLVQFIHGSQRQGLCHLSHKVHPWLSEIRFVPSILCSSSTALRDKVCTIHLVQFIHHSQRQGLYHPSCTVHTAHCRCVLYIWCNGHGSQRQGLYHPSCAVHLQLLETRFVPSISYS